LGLKDEKEKLKSSAKRECNTFRKIVNGDEEEKNTSYLSQGTPFWISL